MNKEPFLESTHKTERSRVNNSFLLKHCQHYSLGALAIVFGIGVVLAGLIITVAGSVLISLVSPSPVVVYSGFVIWLAFIFWLWASLVVIGKTDKKARASDKDLIALQTLFVLNVFVHWLFASPQGKATFHEINLFFEWCVIAFHILTFLLALCVWVRLPARSYLIFIIMLALAIFQTMS